MCYVILSQYNFLYHRMTLTSGFSQKSLNSCDLCHSSNFQTLLHHLIGTVALQSLNNTELSEYVTYKNTIKNAQKKKNHDSHIYYTLRCLGVFITT